jgi:hypothetical protein
MSGSQVDAVREELYDGIVADLLGPAEGSEEEVVDTSVRARYLVGQLAPAGVLLEPDEQDDLPQEATTASDEGEPEEDRLQSESLMPSSMGLTFAVDSETSDIQVEARWGRYDKTESDGLHLTESGQNRMVWKRHPAGGTVTIDLSSPEFPYIPDPENPDVVITGMVRQTASEWLVTLFLVNQQVEPDENKDAAWIFQPELDITAPDGTAVFRRRPSFEAEGGIFGGPEQRAMAMLYRNRVEFAVGHGVSVHAEVPDPEGAPDRASRITTRVVPWYDVPVTEPPSPEDEGFEWLADLVLDMKELSELDRPALVANLRLLADQYELWLDRQQTRIDTGELVGYEQAAHEALARGRRALTRLRAGIDVLADEDSPALDAFRFANRAMWQQRIRSDYVLQRRRSDYVTLSEIDIPENRSWRPFQLAFILLAVPSLADPTHPERTDPMEAIADLLWFPTGGGKTEAYLGVAAYAMALRRLQGDLGGLDAGRGVAVIMRYTLRLLTIQQFQRASTLLCAMEVLRREAAEAGDHRWDDEPFRIGLWVGNRATPGRTREAEEAIREAKGDEWDAGRRSGTPDQLPVCPWCGEKTRLRVEWAPPKTLELGRTLTYCGDEYGRCPFSEARAKGEGLPVVVVDSEIYRLLPTMIIATVDKFAQMPWKGEIQALFGRVSGRCRRHGFLTPASEDPNAPTGWGCSGTHNRQGSLPATRKEETGFLRPPDLIIQDELHLISGPLGTIVGIYETAIDQLCTWTLGGQEIRPKVIASTATVRRATEQVHSLFLRQVDVFPPHGLDVGDDFFSLERPTALVPGRRYLGICAPGKSRPSVLIRVYVAFLTAAQALFEKYGATADPYMTLLGYFNSLRELGGMRRLVEDDVYTRAFRMNQPGQELERPNLAQRSRIVLRELTSRAASRNIPEILDLMETPFDPSADKQKALDVVLATNMVSVGVDVQRLGLMVVAGQPKATAEYIQATSRVGRRYPGLVCTVLNWARPRDLSHYESFEHYHATFYQHVEALSLTPFAPRAVDRALTGVLASLVRLTDLDFAPNTGAGHIDLSHPVVKMAVERIIERAHRVTERLDIRQNVQQELTELIDEWVHEANQAGVTLVYDHPRGDDERALLRRPGLSWGRFTALTSMRDVEPPTGLILDPGRLDEVPDWQPPHAEERA